jgi:hypothetical protein
MIYEDRSGWVRIFQDMLGYFTLDYVRSCYFMLIKISSVYELLGQDRPC